VRTFLFFLFFSGAGLGQLLDWAPPAPLKNKKMREMGRGFYEQATPSGVMGLGAGGDSKA
jgi:hypothetical protein